MTNSASSSIGRNDPCPCQSGMKWKKCCGPRLKHFPADLIPIVMGPSPRDPEKEEAAGLRTLEIRTSEEIQPYLQVILGTFRVFDLPRNSALLHCLRAIHSVEIGGLGMASAALPNMPQWFLYRRMREVQDLLRYLVYEIFSRCGERGSVGQSSLEEIKLGSATASEFSKLSRIRDAVEAVSREWATCDINHPGRLVRIDDPPEALRDVGLRHERIDRRLEQSASEFEYPNREILERLFSSVKLDLGGRSFKLRLDEEIVSSFLPEAESIWRSSETAPLPEHWLVGPYSVGDFRRFFLLLATWVNIQMVVLAKISAEGFVPWNASVPIVSLEELGEFMAVYGSLPEDSVREIVRDLTYNPEEVRWTDTQYQPLIPLGDDRLLLPPLVISGSSFERNLLALVDRLPWRDEAAEDLKRHREAHMLDELAEITCALAFDSKDRIPLRRDGEEVGDVDLLLWAATGDEALAIELKWFYGPDSVHETWAHARRYKDAADKHLRVVTFLRAELRRVIQDYGIEGLRTDAKVTPVVVTKHDEPPRHVAPKGIPIVPMEIFTSMLVDSRGSLGALSEAVWSYHCREPTKRTRSIHNRLRFGAYSFDIPGVIVD